MRCHRYSRKASSSLVLFATLVAMVVFWCLAAPAQAGTERDHAVTAAKVQTAVSLSRNAARPLLFSYGTSVKIRPASFTVRPSAMAPHRISVQQLQALTPRAVLRGHGRTRPRGGGSQDLRPDLALRYLRGSHKMSSVPRSGRGTWLVFDLRVSNAGASAARRFEVAAQHVGAEWPGESTYLSILHPNKQKTVKVRLLVPPEARLGRHTIRLVADAEQINPDKSRANNVIERTVNLYAAPEPDLLISSLKRDTRKRALDLGKLRRGYIDYKLKISAYNRGSVSSPACGLAVQIWRLDHRKRQSRRNPKLLRDWKFPVPALVRNGGQIITSKKFKAVADASYKVIAEIDPDDSVAEQNEANNESYLCWHITVKNPVADFFEKLGKGIKKGAVAIGRAFYKAGKYVWKGIEAASVKALAGIMVPEMMGWVEASYQDNRRHARPLQAHERNVLKDYFPNCVLDGVRIRLVPTWRRPEFWNDAYGVTFKNVVVMRADKYHFKKDGKWQYDYGLLAHEMVHVYQYGRLGLDGFCWRYIYTWVKTGFKYRKISLEVQAYDFVDEEFYEGTKVAVQNFLGY